MGVVKINNGRMGSYSGRLHSYYGNSGAGYYGCKLAETLAEGRVGDAVRMAREALVKSTRNPEFDLGEMLRVLEQVGTHGSVAHSSHNIGMLHLVEAHLINHLRRRQDGNGRVTHQLTGI